MKFPSLLRPVLITASVAALGLIPMIFATEPGSEIQKPLAGVVIGGLVGTTLLTLYLLPMLYRIVGCDLKPEFEVLLREPTSTQILT
jgi:cobalt-zinc-cadmium resistance protein CzcA